MGEVSIHHELNGLHSVEGQYRQKKVWWTGSGWTDQPRGALRYRGTHDAMTAANRLRTHLSYSRAYMPISVVQTPRTYHHRN